MFMWGWVSASWWRFFLYPPVQQNICVLWFCLQPITVSKLLFWYDVRWFASVTFITRACWHNRSDKHEITPFRWNGFSMEESRVIKGFRIESALLTTNKHAFGGMDFREVVKLFIFSRHDVNDTVSSVVFTSLRRISHCPLLFPKSPVLVSEWNPTWGERDESTVPYFAQFLAC